MDIFCFDNMALNCLSGPWLILFDGCGRWWVVGGGSGRWLVVLLGGGGFLVENKSRRSRLVSIVLHNINIKNYQHDWQNCHD